MPISRRCAPQVLRTNRSSISSRRPLSASRRTSSTTPSRPTSTQSSRSLKPITARRRRSRRRWPQLQPISFGRWVRTVPPDRLRTSSKENCNVHDHDLSNRQGLHAEAGFLPLPAIFPTRRHSGTGGSAKRSEETMGINCQDVRRDVSDYIDDELNPAQRAALDRHFAECRDCAALLDGMRNLIAIYGYERVLAPPDGFHERLYQKLEKETKSSRRTFLAWTLVAAAAVPFALAAFSARNALLRGHDGQTVPSSS